MTTPPRCDGSPFHRKPETEGDLDQPVVEQGLALYDNGRIVVGEEPGFREAVFAWLRARMLVTPVFSRDDLAAVTIGDRVVRLIATQSGIWKPKGMVAALSMSTGYYVDETSRPYADGIGADELLRYKWRGTDCDHADNRALRSAMEMQVPLIWFVGVGHQPGSNTQVFQPVLPV